VSVFETQNKIHKSSLEVYNGILCPGFVNTHCHLELSHLHKKIEKKLGLLDFIICVRKRHEFKKQVISQAILEAEHQMIKNGIVAVGDICNTLDTISQKGKGNLAYYNFIEVFETQSLDENKIISSAIDIRDSFRRKGMDATITPHSPYSVSAGLMQKIEKQFDNRDKLFSIHFQESNQENQLFKNKKGKLFDFLKQIKANPEIWQKRHKSIDIISEFKNKKLLFVHNTFSNKEDIIDQYYCTCPKANLYIESRLPDYSIFNLDKLCIGTDSLASNNSLSILEELLVIKKHTAFDLQTLLKIGCKNGAEALGFKHLGTFEKGKKPGVNLIRNTNEIEVIA
jgi:cytosine/adenosine deaminase-related metal-dependent hydrolase